MPFGRLKRTIARSARARSVALGLLRTRARLERAGRPPRVFVTSLPKAGSHLATAVLDQLPAMRFSGLHLVPDDFPLPEAASSRDRPEPERPIDLGRLRRMLESARPGQYVRAHFPPIPALLTLLEELDYRTVFVYRDPRDVAVSFAFYVTDLKRHHLHQRYTNEFKTDAERILASITGFPRDSAGNGLVPLLALAQEYRAWLSAPGVLSSRFEDLVGERGGGSREAQLAAIERIASHVDRPLTERELDAVARRAWSSGSVTFRKGAIGDWTNHFVAAHREAFRGLGSRLLVEYGYEDDDAWIRDAS